MPPWFRGKLLDPLTKVSLVRRCGEQRTYDLEAQTCPSHARWRVVLRDHVGSLGRLGVNRLVAGRTYVDCPARGHANFCGGALPALAPSGPSRILALWRRSGRERLKALKQLPNSALERA